MNVQELIHELEKFDGDVEVVQSLDAEGDNGYVALDAINICYVAADWSGGRIEDVFPADDLEEDEIDEHSPVAVLWPL